MQESVAAAEYGGLILVGLIVQDRLEDAETERLTVPEKPDPAVSVMVEVPEAPALNVTVDGVDEIAKLETITEIDRT